MEFFRLWNTNLLVSVDQTTHQKSTTFMSTKQFH